jgi:hypothetical protein
LLHPPDVGPTRRFAEGRDSGTQGGRAAASVVCLVYQQHSLASDNLSLILIIRVGL